MTTVLIPKVPRTGRADPAPAAPRPVDRQPDLLPDEGAPTVRPAGNRLGVVAALIGLGAAVLAIFTTSTLAAMVLAVLGIGLALAAAVRARRVRTGLIPSVMALVLSLGSLGLLTVFSDVTQALASPAAASSGTVVNDSVNITFGTVTRNPDNGTSLVEVSVRNVGDAPVSTWASLAAMNGTQTVATQGVGVNELQPGATSTQTVVFNADLPANVTFEVRAVL